MKIRRITVALVVMMVASSLQAAERSEEDRARDAGRKPSEVLAYSGIGPGMTVMDVMAAAGWYTEVLANAVGPEGHVVAQNPQWILKWRDGVNDKALDARMADGRLPNVSRLNDNFGNIGPADGMYDAALSALNFHDAYYMFGEDVAHEFINALYSILNPGGVLILIDHVGEPGADNKGLHRIDPELPSWTSE